jgi:hypothetical protein
MPFPLTHDYITSTAILDRRLVDIPDAESVPHELAGARNFLATGYGERVDPAIAEAVLSAPAELSGIAQSKSQGDEGPFTGSSIPRRGSMIWPIWRRLATLPRVPPPSI